MKKDKVILRIFLLIIILLIFIGSYLLLKNNNSKEIQISNAPLKIKTDNNLIIAIADFDTLNPIISKNKDVQYISKLIYNSLLKINKKFELENDLVEEYNLLDEKTYIIKLKNNVYWHDNEKFTGKDVIFTVKKIMENNESLYYNNIENIEKIYELDDYTIKVELKEKDNFFNYLLTFPIISEHNYEENKIVGTGEYRILEIRDSEILLYTENIGYNIKNVTIKVYKTVAEMYNAFAKDKLDLIVTENIAYEEILGTLGYNSNKTYGRNFTYIAINNENETLKNKEVRKALNYFISAKDIVYKAFNNRYISARSPSDYVEGFIEENKDIGNIISGRNILLENDWEYIDGNWTKESQILEFTLIIEKNNTKHKEVAEEIKEQLIKNGIRIKVIELTSNQIKERIKEKNYDLILIESVTSVKPNMNCYFGNNNIFNYYDEETIKNIEMLQNTNNKDIVNEKHGEIYNRYIENIPFINLYYNSSFLLYKENLKGEMEHNWTNVFYNIEKWYKIKIY